MISLIKMTVALVRTDGAKPTIPHPVWEPVIYEDGDWAHMALLTLICPGCEKSTIIDSDDESSYCMHCGIRFDERAVGDAQAVDPVIGAALQMSGILGEEYEVRDYSGEPWYPVVAEVCRKLEDDDPDGAAEELAQLIDSNPDVAGDIEACARDAMTGWIVDRIAEGDPYQGGIAEIARIIEEYGEDSGPNILVASMFYALAQTPELMREAGDGGVIAETLFSLLMEYPEVEPDIREQLELCTDFMHVSGLIIDAADSLGGDEGEMEDIRQWVYALQDFVRIYGDAIYDATEVGDEMLDQLTDVWTEQDIGTIGCNVRDIADRYLEGDIDAEGAKAEIGAYLDDYLSIKG